MAFRKARYVSCRVSQANCSMAILGMGIDNIIGATVVTPSGEIVKASADENPDLFWAIRGAGSNFGVITEFVLKFHPQRETVWGGAIFFAPPQLESLVEAVEEWLSQADPEKEAVIFGFTKTPDGIPVIWFNPFFNGPEEEAKARFSKILAHGENALIVRVGN